MRVVLDTCILKLATFPADNNASALIYELARAGLIEAWVTPAIEPGRGPTGCDGPDGLGKYCFLRNQKELVRPPRLERGTPGLEGRCSIQLSYGRMESVTDRSRRPLNPALPTQR